MVGLLFILILGNVLSFPTTSNQESKSVTKNIENFQNEYIVLKKEQTNVNNRKSGRIIHQTAWSKEDKDDSLSETSSSQSESGSEFNFWSFKRLYDLVLNVVHKLKYFETILQSNNDKGNVTSLKKHKIKDSNRNTIVSQNKIGKSEKFYEIPYLELLKNRTNDYVEKEYTINNSDEFDKQDYEIKYLSGSNENQTYNENKSSYMEVQKEFTEPESSQSLEKHDSTRTENLKKRCKSSSDENLPEECHSFSSVIVEEQTETTDYSKENVENKEPTNSTSNFTETNYEIPISQKNTSLKTIAGGEFQTNKNKNLSVPLNETFLDLPEEIFPFERFVENVNPIQINPSLPRTKQYDSKSITNDPLYDVLPRRDNRTTNLPSILLNNKIKNMHMESISAFNTVSTNNESDILFVNDKKHMTPLLGEPILNSLELSSIEVMESQTKLSKGPKESTLESFTMKQVKDFKLTTAIPLYSTQLDETLVPSRENKEFSSQENDSTKNKNVNPLIKLSETYFGNINITRNGVQDSELLVAVQNSHLVNRLNDMLSKEDETDVVKTKSSNTVNQNDETKNTLFDLFPLDKNKQNNSSEKNSLQPISKSPKKYIDFNKVSNENPDKFENKPIKIKPEPLVENTNEFHQDGLENTQENVPTNGLILNQFYPKENIRNTDYYLQLEKLTDKNINYNDTDALQYHDFETNKNLLVDTLQQLYPDTSRKPDNNEFIDNDKKPEESFDTILQFLYKHSNNRFMHSLKNLTTHS